VLPTEHGSKNDSGFSMTPPPAYLSPSMRRLWRRILADYEIAHHEVPLLAAALSFLDQVEDARATLAIDGLHGPRTHPCVAIMRSSALAAGRLLRQLGLQDVETGVLARPEVWRA
jgi:hypothetical protein